MRSTFLLLAGLTPGTAFAFDFSPGYAGFSANQWETNWVDLDDDCDLDQLNYAGGVIGHTWNNGALTAYAYNPGGSYNAPVIADFDRDGDLDWATTEGYNHRLAVGLKRDGILYYDIQYHNLGTTTGYIPGQLDIDPGDYDEDGDLDLVLSGGRAGPALVMRNDGGGAFTTVWTSPVEAWYHKDVEWVDADSDGCDDLFTFSEETYDRLYLNSGRDASGDCSSDWGTTYAWISSRPSDTYGDVGIADIDGDGDEDFVTAGYYEGGALRNHTYLRRYTNNGDATFTEDVIVSYDYGSATYPGYYWRTLALGDFDDDGDPDIVASAYGGVNDPDNEPQFYENVGGSFDTAFTKPLGFYSEYSTEHIKTLDWDGDGDVDVSLDTQYNGSGRVFLNDRLANPATPDVCEVSDSDGDGVDDDADTCPGGDDTVDTDGDYTANDCDACPGDYYNDSDGDGSCDSDDPCPLDEADDADSDGICGDEELPGCEADPDNDADADGVCSPADVCPDDAANDADGDGVCGNADGCPLGDDRDDADTDGTADACDRCPADPLNDADGDGACGDVDACPYDPEDDADGDGTCGDEDLCPRDFDDDIDADGVCGDVDPCEVDPENDADGDGFCESADVCPTVADPVQSDADGDGTGDACEPDNDGDGTIDDDDNCPLDTNADQADDDGDGAGDACDADDDGDGVLDASDQCLGTEAGEAVLTDGCSVDQECPCDASWKNHGAYVSCVAKATNSLYAAGDITGAEKGAIQSAAGKSSCGAKK